MPDLCKDCKHSFVPFDGFNLRCKAYPPYDPDYVHGNHRHRFCDQIRNTNPGCPKFEKEKPLLERIVSWILKS